MSEHKNLYLEKRAFYSNYMRDGLLDISMGLAIIFAVIFFSVRLFWLIAILPILFSLIWATTKKSSIFPGSNEEAQYTKNSWRNNLVFRILTILGILAFLVGIALFWLFSSGNAPADLRTWVENYFLYICAVGVAILSTLVGFLTNQHRFYIFALLGLVLGIGGPLFNIKPFIYICLFAMLIFMNGILSFVRHLLTSRP